MHARRYIPIVSRYFKIPMLPRNANRKSRNSTPIVTLRRSFALIIAYSSFAQFRHDIFNTRGKGAYILWIYSGKHSDA
jgi:hypothetical protein